MTGDRHDELAAKLGQYFDGELASSDELEVLDHLADCAICQAELDDLLAVHVAATTPPRNSEAPRIRDLGDSPRNAELAARGDVAKLAEARDPRRPDQIAARRASRRRQVVAGGVALAAAAVVAFMLWPRDRGTPGAGPVALALAPARSIEARFEAGPFAAYRPYAVSRGGQAREPIALDALAALERRGDTAALVAALAASGDLARARDLAAAGAISPSDRAALALAAGAAEDAYGLLDGHATTPAATWNLALAARELGLPAVARTHFAEVAARGEPGWRDEAARQVAALDAVRTARAGFRDLQVRGRAMVAGTGPAITPGDAAAFPASARIFLLDALRVAADRDAALALAPVADAVDRPTGTTHARAAVERVAAARFAVRARFRDHYRQLVTQALDPGTTRALIDELRGAGHDADDILVGALIWSGQTRARLSEIQTLVAPAHDPWFDLFVQREQLAAERDLRGAAAVVGRLRAAADACPDAWAYRCAPLSSDAAGALTAIGQDDEAVRHARRARAQYAAAGVPLAEDRALAYLGELERYRDRRVIARATFEEVELRAEGTDCRGATYAQIGRAKLAQLDGRLDDARALLPAADACGMPPDPIALTLAVDLARETGRPADRAAAATWLDAARRAGDPALTELAAIGAGRLAVAADPADVAALAGWLAGHPPGDADRLAQRAWATGALVAAAGERGDWAAADDAARAEIGAPAAAGCRVIASVDQDRQVVAARGADGRWLGRVRRAPSVALDPSRFVPGDVAAALAGCAHVDVIARPPLHGATALLPPGLPWAFVGGPARPASQRPRRTVIVTGAVPPDASLQLPRLAAAPPAPDASVVIRGEAATPSRVLAELAGATYVEIDAHGVADIAAADASFLALSPEPSGRFMLTAGDVRAARLDGAVVVLAACRGARLAPYLHRRWSLPDAFLAAGAHAVIATDIDVPDAAAGPVFDDLRARIERGEAPAAAVAAVRAAAIAAEPHSWAARIAVFE
ncbi:MAG TPA: CHAT domain-containing protein [Kofleriaceae bacterium]|jgi:hypothetical protein